MYTSSNLCPHLLAGLCTLVGSARGSGFDTRFGQFTFVLPLIQGGSIAGDNKCTQCWLTA